MKRQFTYSIGSSQDTTMQIETVKIVINPTQQNNTHKIVSVQVIKPIGYRLTSTDYKCIQASVYRSLDK